WVEKRWPLLLGGADPEITALRMPPVLEATRAMPRAASNRNLFLRREQHADRIQATQEGKANSHIKAASEHQVWAPRHNADNERREPWHLLLLTSRLFPVRDIMKICGACVRELPDGSYSVEQRRLRQSIRRCEECVAAGNQLVLMKEGRTRSEADDCPICQLPLPLDPRQSSFNVCCMKKVCDGCILAAEKRGMDDCPFCRAPTPDESQTLAMVRKRVDKGDPVAMLFLGNQYMHGRHGLEKDVTRAVELYERATELGVKEAHYNLGILYMMGTDVEKDMAKAIRHFEAAAMGGHVPARHNLGCMEYNAGNTAIALQHWMIAAKLGHEKSLNNVKISFMDGLATKADYAAALRGYQKAIDEMSSLDREEAKALLA
ncbi:hypothetical protein THAOC_23965, partial [Thalassiosira oceanica]